MAQWIWPLLFSVGSCGAALSERCDWQAGSMVGSASRHWKQHGSVGTAVLWPAVMAVRSTFCVGIGRVVSAQRCDWKASTTVGSSLRLDEAAFDFRASNVRKPVNFCCFQCPTHHPSFIFLSPLPHEHLACHLLLWMLSLKFLPFKAAISKSQ